MINAIECFAHLQIDDLGVSSFLSTASSIVSVEAIREVSVECHFLFPDSVPPPVFCLLSGRVLAASGPPFHTP